MGQAGGADEPDQRGTDLQSVVTWYPEGSLDRFAVWLHGTIATTLRLLIVLTAIGILGGITVVTGLATMIADPFVVGMVLLSVVPALGLAAFVWKADIGAEEPLSILVATFLLGVLFAAFASVLNGLGSALFVGIPVVSTLLFFYLIVGPVEEGVKLLAVRLYAYRHRRFDAVIDGAVYGAAAGLGFATIENALFITEAMEGFTQSVGVLGTIGETAAIRALVGPGHVIYSAIAGYYLGLAKFNRRYAGPLIIKGLLIAAAIHATYNVLVGVVPGLLVVGTDLTAWQALLALIIVFDGIAGYYLYRLLKRYRLAYRASRGKRTPPDRPELTEFDAG